MAPASDLGKRLLPAKRRLHEHAALSILSAVDNVDRAHPRESCCAHFFYLLHIRLLGVYRLCSVGAILLTFFERPLWCKEQSLCDSTLYPSYQLLWLTEKQNLVIEAVVVSPFVLDLLFCLLSQGANFCTIHRQVVRLFLVLIYASDMVYAYLSPTSWFRLGPYLRIGFLIDYSHGTRHAYRLKMMTIPQIVSYLVLGFIFILFFAWIGILLFPVDSEEGSEFFNGLGPSMWSLFVLITTANFPDVMMPAYRQNRLAFLFFASFILLGIWFLLNVITATIFNTYSLQKETSIKHAVMRREKNLHNAYQVFESNGEKITVDTLRQVVNALNRHSDLAYISKREADELLRELDQNHDSNIDWEEFKSITTLLTKKLQSEPPPPFLERLCPVSCRPWRALKAFVKSRFFDWIVDIVLIATTVVMVQENLPAIRGEHVDREDKWFSRALWNRAEIGLCSFFTFEAFLKIITYGWHGYIRDVKNAFDFVITMLTDVTTVIIILPNSYSDHRFIKIIAAFRILRLARLLLVVERYRVIISTFVAMVPAAMTVLKSSFCTLYMFAVVGVQIFGGVINKDPDSHYFKLLKGTDFAAAGYWENNFNDMPSAVVTLFELIVVNNWFVLADGFSAACGVWARSYFVAFYVMGFLITFNIFLAYTLDNYSTEYAKAAAAVTDVGTGDASATASPASGVATAARVAALEAFVRRHGVDPATITGSSASASGKPGEALPSTTSRPSATRSNVHGLQEREESETNEGSKYKGQWKDTTMHGRGRLQRADGSTYEGDFKDGKADGRGKFLAANGNMYEGEWKNDRASGHGKYTHEDGSIYEGQWQGDEKSGHGTETWADGSSYVGSFKAGVKHGEGSYTSSNGMLVYKGSFKDDKMSGRGSYNFSDGRTYTGEWLDGEMNGEGKMKWSDGTTYEGHYKKSLRDGRGVLTWPDGRRYEGEWSAGKQHGRGVLTDSKGNRTTGTWENGKQIGS